MTGGERVPAAVVLAGGAARRFAGVDKLGLQVGDRTVLDRLLAAVPAAAEVIVVGPPRPVGRPARHVRERPVGGGPVAALAAGLELVGTDQVFLLAGDLPFVTAGTLRTLAGSVAGHDGAVAVDASGRPQPLLSCWVASRLRTVLPANPAGCPLWRTLAALDVAHVSLAGTPPPWWDCDTVEAWEQAKEWVR